jgi:hypothetical protein
MFIFYLYLMLYAYVQRFYVTGNLEKFDILGATKHTLGTSSIRHFTARRQATDTPLSLRSCLQAFRFGVCLVEKNWVKNYCSTFCCYLVKFV